MTMKIRNGFVSNSSSTSFMITNKSNERKTLLDFAVENSNLVDEYLKRKQFSWDRKNVCLAKVMLGAVDLNIAFGPGETKKCEFGTDDCTVIGRVYDFALRFKIGEDRRRVRHSKNFKWRFHESTR